MPESTMSPFNPLGIAKDYIKQFETLDGIKFSLNTVISNGVELDNDELFQKTFKQNYTGTNFNSANSFQVIAQMLSKTLQSFHLPFPKDYEGKLKSILPLDILPEPSTKTNSYRNYTELTGIFNSLKMKASELLLSDFKTIDKVAFRASSTLSYYYEAFKKDNDMTSLSADSKTWTKEEILNFNIDPYIFIIPEKLNDFQEEQLNEFYKGFDAAFSFFNVDNEKLPEAKDLLEKWKERLKYILITGIFLGEGICIVSMIISFVIDFILTIVDLIYMFFKFYISIISSSFCIMVDNAKQIIEDIEKIPKQLEKVQKLAESVLKDLKEELSKGNLTPSNIQEKIKTAFGSLTSRIKIIKTDIGGAPAMEFNFLEPMINDFLNRVKNLDLKELGMNSVKQGIYGFGFCFGSNCASIVKGGLEGEELLEYLWNYFAFDFAYFDYEVFSTVDTSNTNTTKQKWEELGHIQKISACYQFWFNTGWYFGPLCCNLAMCAFGVGEVELILKGVGKLGKFEKFASAARKIEGTAEFLGKFYETIAKPVGDFFSAFQSKLLKWFDDLITFLVKIIKKSDEAIAELLEGAFNGVKKIVEKLMQKSATESEPLSEMEKTYKSVQDFYDVIMIISIIPITVMGIISSDGGELSDATE